jgi:hypothetical protein
MRAFRKKKDPNVVWENTVDARTWHCQVTRIPEDPYRARLRVTRILNDEVILDEEVGLAYGAPFGPDVADVSDWARRVIEVIDNHPAPAEET